MASSSRIENASLPLALIISALIIGGCMIYSARIIISPTYPSPGDSGGSAVSAVDNPALEKSAELSAGADPFIGSASAPVTLYYWYDYQCPICRMNEEAVMGQLIKQYVDAGTLRIVFKDLTVLGPDSTTLALASRAVWEVSASKFYAWHKAVYDNQGKEGSGWATRDTIASITSTVFDKAETDTIMGLMVSHAESYGAAIQADQAEASSIGINGTPSFVIGSKAYIGLQQLSTFKAALDAALK